MTMQQMGTDMDYGLLHFHKSCIGSENTFPVDPWQFDMAMTVFLTVIISAVTDI